MIPRTPLRPNNRSLNKLRSSMVSGVARAKQPKANEAPSILGHMRPGRQNDGGVGGGYRVGNRP